MVLVGGVCGRGKQGGVSFYFVFFFFFSFLIVLSFIFQLLGTKKGNDGLNRIENDISSRNVHDIKLPTSQMLLTHTGKKFSHEWED